jgi:anti-sigma-K factor RskA
MNMRHTELTDDLQERASLYAAGAMSDSERLEYARHLDEDQCAVCQAEVKELQSAISMLAFSVPSSSPSPTVKVRLMQQARQAVPVRQPQPAGFRWLQWATAIIALTSVAVALTLMRTNSVLRRESDALKSRIARLEVQLAERQDTIATLTRAGVRVVDLAGQGTNTQASGRIFWDQSRKQWLFSVRNLPPAPADKTYQLWFVPKNAKPISAKVFNTEADGSITVEVPVPDAATNLNAAAVTTEPFGGQPQPTGPFALLGTM